MFNSKHGVVMWGYKLFKLILIKFVFDLTLKEFWLKNDFITRRRLVEGVIDS